MLPVKDGMSNIDVNALIPQLKIKLLGAWLNNIYQLNSIFLFKFRSVNGENLTLLVEYGKRIHLTSFKRPTPKTPSQFTMMLRTKVKNAKVTEINQYDLDRIVYLKLDKGDEQYTLIFELFGDGNILLLNRFNQILYALKYVKMRDRAILPKKTYDYPPLRGKNPFEITVDELKEILRNSSKDIIHTLISNLNLAADYAEEILINSNIDFKTPAKEVDTELVNTLMSNLNNLLNKIKSGELDPCIFSDSAGKMVNVAPFNLVKYSVLNRKEFSDFNEALDVFFTEYEAKAITTTSEAEFKSKAASLQRIKEEQEAAAALLQSKVKLHKTIGDLIYSNYMVIDELLRTIQEARKKKIEWSVIIDKLNKAREMNIPSALIFKTLKPDQAILVVEVNGVEFNLDFRKSLTWNADQYYQLSKREENKLKGALSALEKTISKLKQLEGESKEYSKPEPIKKTRKKEWYERFRWFITSDNFLVVGGRDAKSNETLIKKFTEKNDIVFHADIHGAPIVVLKSGGKNPSETALKEAAQFAASYSSAWSKGAGGVDVYYIKPEQISFSPPSGQYLPKGSFIINGPRNYVRNQPLNLMLGIIFKDGHPIPVCGPPTAIMKLTKINVPLRIGDLSTGKIAKKIKEYITRIASEEERMIIEELSLDEIQNILPPGGSDIAVKI
ncbi:MAG: ribosome rescue protein RqcH [Candidatus Odinarchaeota archaeon]